MEQNTSKNQPSNPRAFQVDSRNGFTRFIKPVFYAVWTVVGIMVITLLSIAVFGSGTWQENLNISDPVVVEEAEQQQSAQQPQQPQPTEPTEEQLACIGNQLGEERLGELLQGSDVEDAQEAAVVEACLLGQEPVPQSENVEPEAPENTEE